MCKKINLMYALNAIKRNLLFYKFTSKFKPITIQENETQNVNEDLLQFYSTKVVSIPK